MNKTPIDEKNTNFKHTQNSDQNKESIKKSRFRSKSDSNLELKNRKVQVSFNAQPKGNQVNWFEAMDYRCKEIFLNIIHRTIDSSNHSFEIFISLRRVDRFFYSFVCEYISGFLAQFKEPCLANRFDLLKYEDQNTIPDCLTINLKKAFILYKLVINGQYLVYAGYNELFDKRLNDCIARWQDSGFSWSINENEIFEFDCNGLKFVLDPHDIQQCYLISRFIESYFSNQGFFGEKKIHRFIHCEEGGVMEQTTIFVNFLNIYQSYGNVSRIINHLFNDLSGYCNHYDIDMRRTALELLGTLASGNSISIFEEHLAKILNSFIPMMNAIGWEDEGGNEQNSIVAPFLSLIQLNFNNIKKIIFLGSEIKLQDNEISCLLALAMKNLISKELFEELIPHIISEFKNLKSHEQVKCLQLLNILAEDSIIHAEDELFLTTISRNFVFPFVKIVNENKLPLDVVETTLSFLGLFITRNLVSQSEAECLVSLFVKMLTDPEESTHPLQCILFHLGNLVKTNLISQEEAEKFLLLVKKALNNSNANIKINALWIFVNLVTANLITVKRAVDLLRDFNLREQEVYSFFVSFEDLYAHNKLALLELMPLFIPMFNGEKEASTIIYYFEQLLEDKLVSLAIIEQILSFVVELVEQNVVEFSMSASFHCFKALIEAHLTDIEKILSPMFNHSSIEVQEVGLLCVQYFTEHKLISTQIIDEQLPFIIKTIVHGQGKIHLTALEALQSLSKRCLISKTVLEPQLPAIVSMITDSRNEVQKIGFQCLNMLIAAQSITEAQGEKIWNLLISKLNNSEFALFEEVLLVLKNFILHKLISAEDTVIQQILCCTSMMQKTNRCLENITFDFLEASITKGFIDYNTVEMQLLPWVLKILSDSTLNEKRNALLLLHYLVKNNLISKENVGKLMPALKIALNDRDLCIKRNALLFVSYLPKNNENYIEQAVSILSDFTLEEQECLEFLAFLQDKNQTPMSMIVELRALVFLIIGTNSGLKVQEKVEKIVFNSEVSDLTYKGDGQDVFQNQYLLFLRELVGQKILKDYNFTFKLFYYLFTIRDDFKKIAFPMFEDLRPSVKEYVCLMIEYFTKEGVNFENLAKESLSRLIATISHSKNNVQNTILGILDSFIKKELLSHVLVEEQLLSIISMIENSESQVQQGGLSSIRALRSFVSSSNTEKLSRIILSKFNDFQIAQQKYALILLTGFIQKQLISSEIAVEKFPYVVQMIGSSNGDERNLAIDYLNALIEAKYISEKLIKIQLLPVLGKILNDENLNGKMIVLMILHSLIKGNLIAKAEVGNLISAIGKSFSDFFFIDAADTERIIVCLTALVSLADAESISSLHEEALCSLIVKMLDKRKGKSTRDFLLYFKDSIKKLFDILTSKKLISEKSINDLKKLDLDFYDVAENESKVGLSSNSSSVLEIEPNIENRNIDADNNLQKLEEKEKVVDYVNLKIIFKYVVFCLLLLAGIHRGIDYIFNPNDLS